MTTPPRAAPRAAPRASPPLPHQGPLRRRRLRRLGPPPRHRALPLLRPCARTHRRLMRRLALRRRAHGARARTSD
eukprot:2743260-Prymnesium_polylepis.1